MKDFLNKIICKYFGHKRRRIINYDKGIYGIGCIRCKKGSICDQTPKTNK